ncbi:MAG: M67 family peptidase [Ignavibacteriae bacterium]|nr:MAG: M67 family peptidase [Ignavibacteriota bacterium]
MIRLSKQIVDKIEFHAEQTYPEECCGMLLGFSKNGLHHIEEAIIIDNRQDENRRRRFYISPEQYRQAEQLAGKMKMELLGFYHSHPDHPAAPSAFDTDHAMPWFTYIIVSVEKGKAAAMTAWLLNEERTQFRERIIMVGQAAPVPSDRIPASSSHAEL